MSEDGHTPSAHVAAEPAPTPAAASAQPIVVAELPEVAPPAARAGGSGYMPVTDVAAEPILRRQLLFDQAYRLATMTGGKVAEFTQAAFWCAIAASPGCIGGVTDLWSAVPTSKGLDTSEILVFGICIALTIVGLISRRNEETSQEYLHKLFNMPPPKSWWDRFRRH